MRRKKNTAKVKVGSSRDTQLANVEMQVGKILDRPDLSAGVSTPINGISTRNLRNNGTSYLSYTDTSNRYDNREKRRESLLLYRI